MKNVTPNPPTGTTVTGRALFWFLTWYAERYGKPYHYDTQKELARAAGVSEDAVGRILKTHPAWLEIDGPHISIKPNERVTAPTHKAMRPADGLGG